MKMPFTLLAAAGLLAFSATEAAAFGGYHGAAVGAHRIFGGPHAGPEACLQGSVRACQHLERLGRLQPLSRERLALDEERLERRTVMPAPELRKVPPR